MADEKLPGTETKHPRERRRDVRMIVLGVALVLLLWFTIDNRQRVEIHFWLHTSHAPMILVIVITAVLSAAVTALVLRRRKPAPGDQP